MILAISDIHGCLVALETMIDYASPTPDDLVITLGDYVDRGPDSRGVIDYLLEFRKTHRLIHLKGNHELQMEDAQLTAKKYKFWLRRTVGGRQTLDSYGGVFENIPSDHWDFIKSAGKIYETDTHYFVHGGVNPEKPLDQQCPNVTHWRRFYEAKPHYSGKIMVCGHTVQGDYPTNDGFAICLDTCPYNRGWLTALDVETGIYYQTNNRGERRQGHIDRIG